MEHKSCPRCGATFHCQHENPAQCQCAGVELSPATRAHIAEQYPNQCLCRKCLIELGKELYTSRHYNKKINEWCQQVYKFLINSFHSVKKH